MVDRDFLLVELDDWSGLCSDLSVDVVDVDSV